MMGAFVRWILLFSFTLSGFASAEVSEKSDNGFTVRGELRVSKSAEDVWRTLLEIQRWWLASHTYSGDADHLYLDIDEQKCFCERWEQNWVRHLAVVGVFSQRKLVLEGGLGPLQSEAVHGVLTIELEPQMMSTVVRWQYRVHGFLVRGVDKWAAPVNQVLTQQFDSFKTQVSR